MSDGEGNAGAAALAGSDGGGEGGSGPDLSWLGEDVGDEVKAFVGEKKYDSPAAVAKALHSAQKMIGSDKIPVPGEEADLAAWFGEHGAALGVLDGVDAYKEAVARPEMPDGVDYDEAAEEAVLKAAAEGKWPKHIVDQVLKLGADMRIGLINQVSEQQAADRKDFDRRVADEWGDRKDEKLDLARRAGKHFGLDDDTLQEIGGTVGSWKMVSALAKIGEALGEDGLAGKGGGGFGLTVEQAKQQLEARKQDKAFLDKLHDPRSTGHAQAKEQWEALQKAAYRDVA